MIDRGRCNILGLHVQAIDYEAAVRRVIDAATHRQPMAVSALAVHGLMTGVFDPIHRFRLNRFELLVPDGQPVRWVVNLFHGARLPDRVYGPTLMIKLCQEAAAAGLPIFLYGSTPDVLAALAENLTVRAPGLKIAGTQPSRFRRLSPGETDAVAESIRASGARMAFVGLGCPRQEVWAYEYRERLNMPIIAVGAAFAFHAGKLPQAPPLLQNHGLEWLYRFLHEPRRLWKRYLLLNPIFCTLIASQFLRLRDWSKGREVCPQEEMRFG